MDSKIKKVLVATLCLVILTSIGLNIYQYTDIKKDNVSDRQTLEKYMQNHEISFSNVFAGDTPIVDYIKNTENLNRVIDGIQNSESYFQIAKTYFVEVKGKLSGFAGTENLISIGYLSELKSYRVYLESNNKEPYGDINQIMNAMNDFQIIANWLIERNNKNDFTVYTDEDFYNQVYSKLKSGITKTYSKYFTKTDANTPNLSIRSYVLESSDEPLKPSVSIQEDSKFTFIYSGLSSYIGFGSYKIDNNNLILKTDDNKYKYVFEMKNDTLIFNSEKSSAIPSFANMPNGAVFK
ncbi:MAG TPA: hypothetical protein VIK72_11640 [Clostridiaceae bacterium]